MSFLYREKKLNASTFFNFVKKIFISFVYNSIYARCKIILFVFSDKEIYSFFVLV